MKIKIFVIISLFLGFSIYYWGIPKELLSQIMAFQGKEEALKPEPAITGPLIPASPSTQLVSSHADQQREPSYDSNRLPNRDFYPDLVYPIGGFGIKFHHWPSEEEGRQIIQYMKTKGLRKAGQLDFSSKIWRFSWEEGEVKDFLYNSSVCSKLPKFPSVHSCFPDVMATPHSFSSPQGKMFGQSKALDNCGIVKQHKHDEKLCVKIGSLNCAPGEGKDGSPKTLAGQTWAQHQVGADLLKEKLIKEQRRRDYTDFSDDSSANLKKQLMRDQKLREAIQSSAKKESNDLVAVFDIPEDHHDVYVQNLIVGPWDKAVLPRDGEYKVAYYDASTNLMMAKKRDHLLKKVRKTCSSQMRECRKHPPPACDLAWRKCQSQILPSFVNFSMLIEDKSAFSKQADELEKLYISPPKNLKDYETRFPYIFSTKISSWEKDNGSQKHF